MKKVFFCVLLFLATCVFLLVQDAAAVTPRETVLYAFQGVSDGYYPTSGVIADAAGNLYGETRSLVYEVSPPSVQAGPWTETVLYTFAGVGPSGGLVFDSGNLYGTTVGGGNFGFGTVFELSPPLGGSGPWTETTLYNFQGGNSDGSAPLGSLVFDQAGNLYGTTLEGGSGQCSQGVTGCGTVFELSPPSQPGGAWTETVLHIFRNGTDGASPQAGVILDPTGNIYGTTELGGINPSCAKPGCGTVFMLKRPSSQGGAWAERILHQFLDNGVDGMYPEGALTIHGGALYGTTTFSSVNSISGSTVFEISSVAGTPTETILFTSSDLCDVAQSGVVFDRLGDLYVTETTGGCSGSDGYIFELVPPQMPGGAWTAGNYVIFLGDTDGGDPAGAVLFLNGVLYGATSIGGDLSCFAEDNGCGVVFSIGT